MQYGPGLSQSAGLYPSPSPAFGPSYGRDQYAQSVSSSASLSPMSSRLETPQGSSPVTNPTRQEAGSYMHLASSLDGRGKTTTDPTSYTYLAQGANASHNLAGSKRGHEQVEDFFGDMRRKKMAPAYDANMADRLNQTFGTNGLDDASIQAILAGFDPQPAMPFAQRQPPKQEPADLAQLNSFLLQLGASAARDFGSFSSTSSTNDYPTPVDFDLSTLSQYGLNTIPGFDETILSTSLPLTHSRAIAHLPSRASKAEELSSYPAYPYMSQQQPSFDNVRVSRGTGIVPQLAPMDAGGHSYRRVEALTRAVPDRIEHGTRADKDDEMLDVKSTAEPSSADRYRSVSPAGSSESGRGETVQRGGTSTSHGLYPRVSPHASARWTPSSTHETSTRFSHVRRDSEASDTRLSPGPSSPSSSSSLYPSLTERVSRIEGLGRPPAALVSEATRRDHIRLIRDLLVAINFPKAGSESKPHERIRLPPILTSIEKKSAVEEGETTPSNNRSEAERLDEGESDRASTPTPPGRPTLPTLSQLLNNIPDVGRLSRPNSEREMECDV